MAWPNPRGFLSGAPAGAGRIGIASRRRGLRAFVLLEVLISLTILGFSLGAVLRSFTLSLKAASRAEYINTGTLLMQDLIEEIQISPPALGKYSGDFGENYPQYQYTLLVEEEELDYPNVRGLREAQGFRGLKMLHVEVFYDDGQGKPLRVIALDSAILGLQKFSNAAIKEYQLYELF